MILPQSETEFRNALVDAANIGAMKAMVELGHIKPFLKQREAYRMYGEAVVKRWIKEGLINPIKDGDRTASVRIDRISIATVAMTANRGSYLTTQERNINS